VARTYPVGYSVGVTIFRTAAGPTGRLTFRPSAHEPSQVHEGLLSYDALGDVEAIVFALLAEVGALDANPDPF
jgi:hypothetical protein